MRKFTRLNKRTQQNEEMVQVTGNVVSFSENPIANKTSGKKYHRFTAEVEGPKGSISIGGQVYEALIPHLGSTPKIGDKLDFAARIEDLKAGHNAYWGIAGNAIDEVSEDFLEAIAGL